MTTLAPCRARRNRECCNRTDHGLRTTELRIPLFPIPRQPLPRIVESSGVPVLLGGLRADHAPEFGEALVVERLLAGRIVEGRVGEQPAHRSAPFRDAVEELLDLDPGAVERAEM